MMEASDALLLEVAGIAASLLGFFVVGVFFYVQRGLFPQAAEEARTYLRSATGSVILLYGMTLVLSLSLVAFPVDWVALIHLVASSALLWSVARTASAGRRLHRVTGVRVLSQVGMWSAVVAIVGLPFVLGGLRPSLTQLTLACLLAGGVAFASSASLVLSTFDIAGLEAAGPDAGAGPEVIDPLQGEAVEEPVDRVERVVVPPG